MNLVEVLLESRKIVCEFLKLIVCSVCEFLEDVDEILHFKIDTFQPFADDQAQVRVVLGDLDSKAFTQLQFEKLELGTKESRRLGIGVAAKLHTLEGVVRECSKADSGNLSMLGRIFRLRLNAPFGSVFGHALSIFAQHVKLLDELPILLQIEDADDVVVVFFLWSSRCVFFIHKRVV